MHYFASFRYRTILPDGFQKLSAKNISAGHVYVGVAT